LPEGNTKSRMYVNGTLWSWIHNIDVRTDNGTQQEHKEVAINCALEISKIFPLIT
jgi:thymidylate synthase (FAD)